VLARLWTLPVKSIRSQGRTTLFIKEDKGIEERRVHLGSERGSYSILDSVGRFPSGKLSQKRKDSHLQKKKKKKRGGGYTGMKERGGLIARRGRRLEKASSNEQEKRA